MRTDTGAKQRKTDSDPTVHSAAAPRKVTGRVIAATLTIHAG
jgi:hypothetical protein